MPGGGKSTVGRLLARRLNVSFADVDHEIERQQGCSVSELFARGGEPAFRTIEGDVLMRLVDSRTGVIATGGGAVVSPSNRRLLRDATVPVYLEASLAELWRRLRRSTRRPLLQVADPRARLEELLTARHPMYSEVARITVQTGAPSMSQVVETIVAELERVAPP